MKFVSTLLPLLLLCSTVSGFSTNVNSDGEFKFFQNQITGGAHENRRLSLQCVVTEESEPTATCLPKTLPVSIATFLDPSNNVRMFRGEWNAPPVYLPIFKLSKVTTLSCENDDDFRSCHIEYSVVLIFDKDVEVELVNHIFEGSEFRGGIQTTSLLNSPKLLLSEKEVNRQAVRISHLDVRNFYSGILTKRIDKNKEARPQITTNFGIAPHSAMFENPNHSPDYLSWIWFVCYSDEYTRLLTAPKEDYQLVPELVCEFTEGRLVVPDTCSVTLSWGLIPDTTVLSDGAVFVGTDPGMPSSTTTEEAKQPDVSAASSGSLDQKEFFKQIKNVTNISWIKETLRLQGYKIAEFLKTQEPWVLVVISVGLQFSVVFLTIVCWLCCKSFWDCVCCGVSYRRERKRRASVPENGFFRESYTEQHRDEVPQPLQYSSPPRPAYSAPVATQESSSLRHRPRATSMVVESRESDPVSHSHVGESSTQHKANVVAPKAPDVSNPSSVPKMYPTVTSSTKSPSSKIHSSVREFLNVPANANNGGSSVSPTSFRQAAAIGGESAAFPSSDDLVSGAPAAGRQRKFEKPEEPAEPEVQPGAASPKKGSTVVNPPTAGRQRVFKRPE